MVFAVAFPNADHAFEEEQLRQRLRLAYASHMGVESNRD